MTAAASDSPSPRNAVDNPHPEQPVCTSRRATTTSRGRSSPRLSKGRRPAGYHGVPRTRANARRGRRYARLPPSAARERYPRAGRGSWRVRGYPNVTTTTRILLEHWNRRDRRSLFFCQREAAETLIWLARGDASRPPGHRGSARHVPNDLESGAEGLRRRCAVTARRWRQGRGRPSSWQCSARRSILNKVVNRQDTRFSDSVLHRRPEPYGEASGFVCSTTKPGRQLLRRSSTCFRSRLPRAPFAWPRVHHRTGTPSRYVTTTASAASSNADAESDVSKVVGRRSRPRHQRLAVAPSHQRRGRTTRTARRRPGPHRTRRTDQDRSSI